MKRCKLYPVFKWHKLIAIFGETEIFEKHKESILENVQNAREVADEQVAEIIMDKCVKFAKQEGLCCVVLDTSGCDEQTIIWGPWYGAACEAMANKDSAKLQMLITGMELANVEVGVLFRNLSQDLNCVNRRGETSLIYAAKRGIANRRMYKALLSAGANPNICDREGKSALDYAIEAHNGELIRLLLQHGAKFDWENGEEEEVDE